LQNNQFSYKTVIKMFTDKTFLILAAVRIITSVFCNLLVPSELKLPQAKQISIGSFEMYEGGSKSFRRDIQKPHQMENAARDKKCHLW